MNRDKFIERLQKVRVPYRFSLRGRHLLTLKTLQDKPYELAYLAFNFGFLQGQRAVEAEALKKAKADMECHARGYGLLLSLIENHADDAEFIKWVLAHAWRLDQAYQEIEDAAGQRGGTRHGQSCISTRGAAFISYQQAGTGRDLSEGEIELLRLAASYINIVYKVGLSSSAPYSAVMEIFKSNLAEVVKSGKRNDPVVSRFLSSLLYWETEAYRAGRRDAEEATR